jgi:hypothetical protein
VHSTRTLDRARILVIASDVHVETGRKFDDAKKRVKSKEEASERGAKTRKRASKQVFVRSRKFGSAVRRKTNESCPRVHELNESEKRKARYARHKARSHIRTATCDDAINIAQSELTYLAN